MKLTMSILDFTFDDLRRIRHLQPEGWTDIVPEFEYYLRKPFCFPIKVTIGDQIAGTGAAIALGSTGWLAHIIVDPAERKKGLGTLIVNELMHILRGQGVRTFLLIATEAGKSLYLRTGFRIKTEYIFHKRETPCPEYRHTANIVSFSQNFRRELLNIDRRVTGENREELLGYSLENASLFISDSALLGYYIPGVGEGPVIALTAEAGLELMKLKYANVSKAVLPAENITGLGYLRSMGFEMTPTRGTRMVMGEDIPWEPEKIYSRIGGNFG